MADTERPADLHEYTKAERYDYMKSNPSGAAHLFTLLFQGKGNADSFDTMLCRIMRSAGVISRGDGVAKEEHGKGSI